MRVPEPLAPLEPLDRRIVAALQVDGRASWAEVARLVGTSETTVARRAQALLDARRVAVTVVRDPVCAGRSHVMLSRIRCAPGRVQQVARALAERPDVRFVSLVTGDCDVVCEFVLPRGRHAARMLLHELQQAEGVTASETEPELHTFKVSFDWSRQDLVREVGGPGRVGREPPREHLGGPHALDEVDERIIGALAGDGRRTFAAVAGEVGVNETTVRRRSDVLRSRGCLRVATLVPAALLGYEAEQLITLELEPPHLQAAAAVLAEHTGVRFVALTMGRLGLLCEVVLPSLEAVYEFTNHTLGTLSGLRRVRVNVELLTVKRGHVLLPDFELLTMQEAAGAGLRRKEPT